MAPFDGMGGLLPGNSSIGLEMGQDNSDHL